MKINELKENNQTVTLNGFVDKIRNLQYVQFVILRDTTGKVQITIEKNEENKNLVEIIDNLKEESTIKVTGTLVLNEKIKLNGMEIIPQTIEVTSNCTEDLPLNYKDQASANIDTRLNYRFLDLRNEKNLKIHLLRKNK